MGGFGKLKNWVQTEITKLVSRHLKQKENLFVSIVLCAYFAGTVAFFWLYYNNFISQEILVSFAVTSPCVAFCFSMLAFFSKVKTLESSLKVQGAIAAILESTAEQDSCVKAYAKLGDAKSSLLKSRRSLKGAAPEAVNMLSLDLLNTCVSELDEMRSRARIHRYGDKAHTLTQGCYAIAKHNIQAVALTDQNSIKFWSSRGLGRVFFDSNKAAVANKVEISRYFRFGESNLRELESDAQYRRMFVTAINDYIAELPTTKLVFVYCEDWQSEYPDMLRGGKQGDSNRRFKEFFSGSFPDVSIFDGSVASLWRGATNQQIHDVRIAWETHHVECVKNVFEVVFKAPSVVSHVRQGSENAETLVDTFLAKCKTASG